MRLTAQLSTLPLSDTIDGTVYWWLWLYGDGDDPIQVLCPPGWKPIMSGPTVMAPGRVMIVEGEWVTRKAPKRREADQPRFIRAASVVAVQNEGAVRD